MDSFGSILVHVVLDVQQAHVVPAFSWLLKVDDQYIGPTKVIYVFIGIYFV